MNNFFDVLKTIYTKEKLELPDDLGSCIAITKTLARDQETLPILRKLSDFLFYVSPKTYFFLLYFTVKKKQYVPKFIKLEKKDDKESELLKKLQHVLGWSSREMFLNHQIIKDKILSNEKEWKEELGVK